ncbi:MAG: tRNA (N6-threonylcarbamoyladenosine(37)-N6)-methyltransferase TrmO [Hyphomicrobiaceae bacterium]|nr:tRNA (N6-threonylcarbamoyladenosine(37)-N6)-methyltransferase TrmO [Hyphomicrobiaceae bacterium]
MVDNKKQNEPRNNGQRQGEIALPFDPAETAKDAAVVFIGLIRSPWESRKKCPKNMAQARERGQSASIELDEVWRAGLDGLEKYQAAIVLYWMDKARRDLIVQSPNNRHKSRHKPGPRGVFSLRSPVRPNPVAIATVRILDIDKQTGKITIDAIDCLDGTPLIDIKPWIGDIDVFPSSVF